MNFDTEQYSETICDQCGNTDNIMGNITWKPTSKQLELAERYRKTNKYKI
jgi:hypothetical protein